MEFLQQRHWHTTVMREDKKTIIAKTDYMDNLIERRAVIKVDVFSLEITEAWLERLGRAGDMAEKRHYIEKLKGVKAYLGNGRPLKEALQEAGDQLERSLFNESVIGIIQAETFLFEERGYPDAATYNQFWEEYYLGSCRYYSNLDQVKSSWIDFVGTSLRQKNLFNRGKCQQMMRDQNGDYLIWGSLIDTFHQMGTFIKADQGMKITAAHGQLIRMPDAVCSSAAGLMDNLPGVDLSGISKKELAGILGAGQGCIHIIDLVWDSVQTICCL